jgi:carbonic anhydrase
MKNKFSMSPGKAFEKIKEGHRRFLEANHSFGSGVDLGRIQALTKGQTPYATILSCSDSRVPPEYLFGAGFGDLFICRNAGNIIDEVVIGSIEYAAAHTGCPLLIVLGHENCGAIGATVAHFKDPERSETQNIDEIIWRIMPAVLATKKDPSDPNYFNDITRKNVSNICKNILERSRLLDRFVSEGVYKVVGGFYRMSTGRVDFFE